MVTAEIRKFAPSIVFAPYWEDRHPDHVACDRLVEEAVFNAKLRRYMPERPPVKVDELYFISLMISEERTWSLTLRIITPLRSRPCLVTVPSSKRLKKMQSLPR